MWKIERGWFGHWHVYSVGHTVDDVRWLATFRQRGHAEEFVETRGWLATFRQRGHAEEFVDMRKGLNRRMRDGNGRT